MKRPFTAGAKLHYGVESFRYTKRAKRRAVKRFLESKAKESSSKIKSKR